MRMLIGSLLSILALTVSAEQIVKLEDGRSVLLKDDFSWQYVVPTVAVKNDANAVLQSSTSINPLSVAIPVISSVKGTSIFLGSNKPVMQLSDNGVDLLIGAASYKNGLLIMPTQLTNQSSQSVVLVEVEATLSDSKGKQLLQEELKIWSSIKRVADTYFRPKTQRQGKSIELKVPEQSEYNLQLEVIKVEHW
ncbi:DUF3157 domain-containing protein [Pelagibaculum spongiae]|uniref:DUF3157 domain-containing protein n=1 Tax=Pelagibaculum spongiae TaxID=2080658 RepID=A0A2V1H1S1_9GAMM|nr:DUF3157 domain-containing protein [Pelagibaculum spongiae]